MGILHSGADTKNIGDIFETIAGAYYMEKGFDALHAWASPVYEPLIQAASDAFDEVYAHTDYTNPL
jgi:dsRNA-specific ribonuclease